MLIDKGKNVKESLKENKIALGVAYQTVSWKAGFLWESCKRDSKHAIPEECHRN